jgi:hypothetical protein
MKTQSSVPKVKPVARAKRVTMFEMPPLPSLFTQPLGLEGWAAYEPVLIAALASGEPLLLIGAHGSAKSFLLERLAQSLGLEYRFYNASLINYDDLVGFPIPDEERKSLRYISTPSAIWDAQVVFFDEINRTRPELQNKLFPIIHERRVQGIKLDRLIYRWSAMNPPPSVDGMDDTQDIYLGAEPLDPALADRFAFLIEVPTWQHLTDVQKRAVFRDQFRGEHDFPVGPSAIVAAAQRHLALSPAFTSTRTLSSAIAVVTSICSCLFFTSSITSSWGTLVCFPVRPKPTTSHSTPTSMQSFAGSSGNLSICVSSKT